jgi:hypothetical protein
LTAANEIAIRRAFEIAGLAFIDEKEEVRAFVCADLKSKAILSMVIAGHLFREIRWYDLVGVRPGMFGIRATMCPPN